MYFSLYLIHLNEHSYVPTENKPIFMRYIQQKYVFIVNFENAYLPCQHHVNELRMIPYWHFCVSVARSILHPLIACILYTIIFPICNYFSNDELVSIQTGWFHLCLASLDLYEKLVRSLRN